MRVRVINKSKQGVTFKVLDLPKNYGEPRDTATWDDFNKMFEPVPGEKFIYKSNENFDKEQEEKVQLFTKLFPTMLKLRAQQGANNFTDLMMLSRVQEEYHEKFGGAPIDFIREYRQYEKVLLEQFMMDGIGVGKVHRDAYSFREDRWTPEEKKKIEEVNKKADETYTIGDMLKAKEDASK